MSKKSLKKDIRIAVIGAGLAGVSAAYFLKKEGFQVSLYDQGGIGAGASGIASGLLHGFPGVFAQKKPKQYLNAAKQLLEEAQKQSPAPLYKKTSLLRPASNKNQAETFKKQAQKHSDFLAFCEASQTLTIKEAYQVETLPYLKALVDASALSLVKKKVTLSDLADFDHVLVACGCGCLKFEALKTLPLSLVKGQLNLYRNPKINLPLPINKRFYLLQSITDPTLFLGGATFEKVFNDEKPSINGFTAELSAEIEKLAPGIGRPSERKAAFRVRSRSNHPIAKIINPKLSVFTGLGGKGLLYHAHLAKTLSQEVAEVL